MTTRLFAANLPLKKKHTNFIFLFGKLLHSSPSQPPSTQNLQPIQELPPNLQKIFKQFQSVQESKAKYEKLMFYGKNLKPLSLEFKTRENKVKGCVSQVWIRAYLDEDGNIVYEADTDSAPTRGLAALVVTGLSGRPVPDILRVSPDFVLHFCTHLSLTPSRNNGFLNMFNLIKKKALELAGEGK